MRFVEFKIKNYKGIEEVTINLEKSPTANIYTLVGLNESGKTTILEAINFFNPEMSPLDIPGSAVTDYNDLIPISQRDNFNDKVTIEATLKLEDGDLKKINDFTLANTDFKFVEPLEKISHFNNYLYENSKFIKSDLRWTGFAGVLKSSTDDHDFIRLSKHDNNSNFALFDFCKTLTPSILYFPNFLFDFPSKIYLDSTQELTKKERFYLEIIQDILFSLNNDSNYKTHIIERAKSNQRGDKRSLDSLLKKMSRKVSDVVFDAWNKIFKREMPDAEVVIKCDTDEKGQVYLEFEIEGSDGIYQINDRSLGFRWFFTFLLFTQFRPYRENSPQNVLFLFDEPASNLHSLAQSQLLKSFENLTENCKIIYTTHSHHLINPHWLESTYIVKNEGLNLESIENTNIKKTKVTIQSYREFVISHPHNTAYFQPILDVLDYAPSNLESLPNCIFIEGKNDFYCLAYFQEVIFKYPSRINLSPSTGSGNLDTLISLYIGWGKNFLVVLDSDKEGMSQKGRYIEKFGILVESRIYTLADIETTWDNKRMEGLFDSSELIRLQKVSYPNSAEFNKTNFNRAVQECLIKKVEFDFCEQTLENFKKVFQFLNEKITTLT